MSEVTSIYDGDTFRVTINGWPTVVGYRMPVRINGIDTPDLRGGGKCPEEKERAQAAKQFTVAALRGAKSVDLRNIQRGKYFRLLAEVFVNGVSLGNALMEQGHAAPYDGGTKMEWCSLPQ